MLRVFVSSTSKDMAPYRKAVRDAILGLEMFPVMMEDFPASDSLALDKCKVEVEKSDIFIGIYGYRYGFTPPGETKSITELEYDWARAKDMPTLVYVADEKFNWPQDLKDEDLTQISAFKSRVGLERVWETFTTPESLSAGVTQGLAELERPTMVRTTRRQLVRAVVALSLIMLFLLVGLSVVLQQNTRQQVALQQTGVANVTATAASWTATPTMTFTPSPTFTASPTIIPTAITAGDNREVLVLLTQFDKFSGSNEDPAVVWERTMQQSLKRLKAKVRIAHYDKVVTNEEDAKRLAAQYHATLVIWGWVYGDVSLTTEYTITPQWSTISEQQQGLLEIHSEVAPGDKISLTIARGGDTEYALNFVLGQLEYFGENKAQAMSYFDRCIALTKSRPVDEQARMGVGSIQFFRGWLFDHIESDAQSAIDAYSQAVNIMPSLASAWENRGLVHYDLGQYDDALADLTQAIKLDLKYAPTYLNRAVVNIIMDRYDDALRDASQAIKLDPKRFEGYVLRGLINTTKGDYDQALADYSESLKLQPDNTIVYLSRGLLYSAMDKPAEAIKDYNEALRLSPDSADAYEYRASAYAALGEIDKALADFEHTFKLDPDYAIGYYDRGRVYQALGKYAEALADFKQYVKLEPNDADGKAKVAEIEALLTTSSGPTPTDTLGTVGFPTAPASGGARPTATLTATTTP